MPPELDEAFAHRADRGARRLRQRRRLYGEIPRPAAPYRAADPGRCARQRGASRRTRLLACSARHQKLLEEAGSPALTPPQRDALGRTGHHGAGSDRLPQCRHLEFLYQDGQFSFIEMNTQSAGRTSGHRDGVRHRPGARADPHRRRRAARLYAGGHPVLRPCDRVPHQRRGPDNLPPVAAAASPPARRPAAWRARRFARCTPAIACRRITTVWLPS